MQELLAADQEAGAELDLTSEPLDLTETETPSSGPVWDQVWALQYDPAKDREHVRGWIVRLLVLGLLALGLIVLMGAWFGPWTKIKDALLLLLPVVTGLLGTALGFYFGTHARS